MYVSLAWLSRHVDLAGVDIDELANRFTLSVAELEGVTRIEDEARAVVGRVESLEPIPGGKLKRCRVNVGARSVELVCGAPNVAQGQHVAVVLPGGRVLGQTVAVREVQGVRSEGLLASEHELGIGPDQSGILVLDPGLELGRPLADLAPMRDVILELDNKSLTHRPDLWGHRGIAREVAALFGRRLKPLALDVELGSAAPCEIEISAPDACRRYCALSLQNFAVGPSPLWLRVLLHRVGTRPISNVVDATNFVMLDLGNPVHAFDRRRLAGRRIRVRYAAEGETLHTLDGIERRLTPRDLVIADGERALALAGIMGGEQSGIEDSTRALLLEAANFDPATVRVTAQRLGLRTEASARFEKSLDPALAPTTALAFACLMRELCPGLQIDSSLAVAGAPDPEPRHITLRVERVRRRLGVDLPVETIAGYLSALEFELRPLANDAFDVRVPSFRATKDITEEVDLIEEVGRCHGYNNIPPAPPAVILKAPDPNLRRRFERRARAYLTQAASLDELLSYSFSSEAFLAKIGAVPSARALVKNPISSDLRGLRTELGSSLLEALDKNAKNFESLGFFEMGRVFLPVPTAGALPEQPTHLGALIAEAASEPDPDARIFFRLKGYLEGLVNALERPALTFGRDVPALAFLHPSRRASVSAGSTPLGYIAEVHPTVITKLDRPLRVALFEIDLDALRALTPAARNPEPPPQFPATYRDFAFVVSDAVAAEQLRRTIADASPLVDALAFESIYRGSGVPDGSKCLAWSVTFRTPERTLTDSEVQTASDAIVAAVGQQLKGRLR